MKEGQPKASDFMLMEPIRKMTFQLGEYIQVILPNYETEEAWEKAKKMMEIYFEKTVVPGVTSEHTSTETDKEDST